MSIFRKWHIKLFLIVKGGDPFWLWLHVYSVFDFFTKTRSFIMLVTCEPVWRSVYSNLQRISRSTGSILLIFFKFWNRISRFFIFQVPKYVFWGLGTFLDVFGVSKNHGFGYRFEKFLWIWADPWYKLIVYMLSSIWHYYFFKNNYIKFEMIVKGVSGKSGLFLIELPIALPIGSCYSGVE